MTSRLRFGLVVCACGALLTAAALPAQAGDAGVTPQVVAAPPPNQPPAEAGTGTISGVITDAGTGDPVGGAIVYLGPPQHGPPGAPIRQLTDARGRFAFSRLPAFDGYFLQVAAGGYFRGYYGRASSGALGSRIAIREGEWFGEANVALERPATLSGRVVDERGDPLVGVYVRVLPRMFIAGRSQFVAGPLTTTDDRGVYRISGLTPGDYVVQVPVVQGTVPESVFDPPADDEDARPFRDPSFDPSPTQAGRHRLVLRRYPTPLPPADGRLMAYPLTFFPSTSSPLDAAVLQLGSGEARAGIDIQLRPVTTYRLGGRLDGPPEAIAGVVLRALPPGAEYLGHGTEMATTISESDGSFTFFNLPAGSYTLRAHNSVSQYEARLGLGVSRAMPEPAGSNFSGMSSLGVLSGPQGLRLTTRRAAGPEAWQGSTTVRVESADVTDVVIPMADGASISGRFVWDDPALAQEHGYPRSIRLEPADGDPTLGSPSSRMFGSQQRTTDRFQVDGLLAGRYVLGASVLGGGRIKSMRWNGQDYTNRPFDASSGADITDVLITLTAERCWFTGTVRDTQGRVVDEAGVIVFPVERDQWTGFGFTPDRIKAIQTTNAGGFTFQSLPAGRYLAVAVDADLVNAWQDSDFLRRAAEVATPFELEWGQTRTLDLRLVTVGR